MKGRPGRLAILEQLVQDDVRYMFGNPGTVEQGFLDCLSEVPDLQYIMGLQETIPVAIADAYARATKKPAVVQLHSGVGLGNGVGMLYQALRGHAPLVVLCGEAGVRYDAMDAQMACDLVAMARPVTKWSARVIDPSSILRMLRRAIKMASTPPMGPVFLCLPMDVLDADTEEEVGRTSVLRTRGKPEPGTIEEIAGMLAAAKKPMLIVGDGVAASGAAADVAKVAELAGAEVWGGDSSEVNMDAAHPLFRGLLGHMFGSSSAPIVSGADAVLIVGTYVFPEVFPALEKVFAPGARVAHIDLNAYEIAKNFPVDVGILADPKSALAALAEALPGIMKPAQNKAAVTRGKAIAEETARRSQATAETYKKTWDDIPMKPARFMEALSRRLDEKAVIFDEALTVSPELNFYIPARIAGHFFQTRGGSLGVGVPGAIGLKLAHPDNTVVGFSGDGGSMYTIQALWTAAKYDVGAKFVICNNASYKLLKLNVRQYWRERGIAEHEFPSMFDLGQPPIRFDELSRSLGVPAETVARPEDIEPALDRAFETEGPYLIDLVLESAVAPSPEPCKCGQ